MPQPPPIPNQPSRQNSLPTLAGIWENVRSGPGRELRPTLPPPQLAHPAEAASSAWTPAAVSETSLRNTSSFLVSLVVHCLLLIALALISPASDGGHAGVALVVDVAGESETPTVPEDLSLSIESPEWDSAPVFSATSSEVLVAETPPVPSPFAAPAPVAEISLPTQQMQDIPASSLLIRSTLPVGGGIEGRTQSQRARLAGERGGTPASEDAVELALVWLAEHQRADGSWSLKLDDPCQGRCTHPGMMESNTGATALALLPFLGAGYSHQEGPYQEVVKKGLYYLTTRMVETSNGGDLTENVTMYAQGLATLALCEGLAMTDDENLRPFAQKAVDFICYAQHPAGGWRYFPGQPGDTTVTGWQVMALKSARLAHLSVPSQSTQLVQDYLDSVQESNGAFYGYQRPDKQPGPTSVGLLLRMYSGWQRDDDRVRRGVGYLAQLGPSKTDVYFDYYATMVLNHHGGPQWERWNARMRDHLVATQAKSGHERGSWFFPDRHGTMGGRLYTTAMCAMILEVYYRYMPLYGDEAIEDRF